MNTESGRQLFSLTLPARRESIALTSAVIEPVIDSLSFDERGANRTRLAVEEACMNVIDHAYEPGREGDFTLRARIERSSLVLSIEDRGLPRDPFARHGFSPATPDKPGLGTHLMEAMTDGVRYLALGRGGKAVELIMRLPAAAAEEPPPAAAGSPSPVVRINPELLHIRPFRPEDAGQIAQCAYRCYDYSYVGEHLYVPERVIEMNRSGEMVSIVAADASGRIYGHAAILFSPGAPSPESGQAFVVPEARGGGTFRKIKLRLLEAARERGAPGVWSEAVTNHPASQRANLELGVHETGMLFGAVPPQMRMRNLPGLSGRRGSLILLYFPLEEHPASRVCLPLQHRGLLLKIYERMGFTLEEMAPETPAAGTASEVEVGLRSDIGLAEMRVKVIGADICPVILHELARVCDGGARTVMLDLPIRDPAIPGTVSALEFHGFHFAGIIPRRYMDGDSLRMTYLEHVRLDLGALQLASDFGREICDYCARGLSPDLLIGSTEEKPPSA